MIPSPYLLIADPKILSVTIEDNGEPLVDLRNYPEIAVIDPPAPEQPIQSKVRPGLAKRLQQAATHLPSGVRFSLVDAWRPLSVQQQYFNSYQARLKQQHPEWGEQQLFDETTKFVAPAVNNPPHSTGGAVDITLVDAAGQELDMGAARNNPSVYDHSAETLWTGISSAAKHNRGIMAQALDQLGFVNYPTEWWHWSYGDRYWAYYRQEPKAIYGSIES